VATAGSGAAINPIKPRSSRNLQGRRIHIPLATSNRHGKSAKNYRRVIDWYPVLWTYSSMCTPVSPVSTRDPQCADDPHREPNTLKKTEVPYYSWHIARTRLPTQRKIVDLLLGYIEIDSPRIRPLDCTKRNGDIIAEECSFAHDEIVALHPERADGPKLFILAIVDWESLRKIARCNRWIILHCCRIAFRL
jgi:hypothetical protein